jgi:hypothetical protein
MLFKTGSVPKSMCRDLKAPELTEFFEEAYMCSYESKPCYDKLRKALRDQVNRIAHPQMQEILA